MEEVRTQLRGEKGSWIQVLDLAYPVILSMLSWTVMWTIDTIFVGRLGTAEQGAVGFAGAMAWTLLCFIVGTLNAVQIFIAQHFGARQYSSCGRVYWQGMYLALMAGGVALSIGVWGGGLVSLFRIAPELEPHAQIYFRIRLMGGVFTFLTYACEGLFRGVGDTKTPMKVAIFASGLNILLDYALIFGKFGFPSLGVAGAAIATITAIGVQAVICITIILRGNVFRERYCTLPRAPMDGAGILRLLRVGGPVGLQWVLDMASWTLFTSFIARLGAVPAAANQIAITMLHISFMPGWAISTAATTLVGQYLGAGDPPTAKRSATNALRIAVSFMGLMGLFFFTARRSLVSIFNPDLNVVSIGADLLIFAAIFQIFDAMAMVSGGILRGSGDTRSPAVIQVGLSWLFFIPLVYLVCIRLGHGARGGWLAATAYIMSLGIVLYSRYRKGTWMERVLLHESGTEGDMAPIPGPEITGSRTCAPPVDGSLSSAE